MSIYVPLAVGTRVLADTSIEIDHPSGHTWVHAMPSEFWAYPLDDHVVEVLAQTAHDAFFEEEWESTAQVEQELWRKVIEAVFAKLMDGQL